MCALTGGLFRSGLEVRRVSLLVKGQGKPPGIEYKQMQCLQTSAEPKCVHVCVFVKAMIHCLWRTPTKERCLKRSPPGTHQREKGK